ncbi:MAG TPA: S8 family peptidase [Acidimicrobiales bacterium]|nr:S8 family peptidase [Acidimicrobiales bacterium]
MGHLARTAVLGIDPRLVLVFELGAPVEPEDFRRAGLRVLDASHRRVVIAFADDPELAAFNERLDALQGGAPEGQKSEPYAAFFDAIDSLRTLGPDDRVTERLAQVLASGSADGMLRLDVECWHPDDRDLAADWLAALSDAVDQAGGRVADRYVHDAAGLLLARVYAPAKRVHELAELDFVARIDVLPTPALTVPQLLGTDDARLPPVEPPADGAPIVGVIDSGVRSAHPLLAGAVVTADALGTGIADGQDEHGHGTMIAALILHGRVDSAIARGLPLRPLAQIVSARVLNSENQFPEEDLWERDLADAVEWCVDQGASVINISLGDNRAVLSEARQMSAAAVIDALARRHGVTIVICTGNIGPLDYMDVSDEGAAVAYPAPLLDAAHARLIDPAPAMLALTVGGMTQAAAATGLSGRETVVRVPMGRPGWPSPFTRVGPGVGGAVKPELVELAGTLGIESGRLVDNDAELSVISAGAAVDRLLAFDVGTSFAAPLATRVATAVKARFPDFSANLVRALVLSSAEPPAFGQELEAERPSDRAEAVRRLFGYGRPSIARATESTTHRVVLVAEDQIPIDGIHIYEIPVPEAFFAAGGQRGLDVALAYSPRTRAHRLDYMASRMEFHLVRGMPLDDVARIFAQLEDEADDGENADTDVQGEAGGQELDAEPAQPTSLRQLGSRYCGMSPSTTVRSRGANQLGRVVFSQRLDRDRHTPMHLVVRNLNRWDDSTATQPYALALALWRTESHGELYAELEARLETVVEVPVEIELRP